MSGLVLSGACVRRTASVSACVFDVSVGNESIGVGRCAAMVSMMSGTIWFQEERGGSDQLVAMLDKIGL